jgi:hypothetical protein
VRPLDAAGIQAVFDAARRLGPEAAARVALLIDGGVRAGEASAIRFAAVRFSDRIVTISESMPRVARLLGPADGGQTLLKHYCDDVDALYCRPPILAPGEGVADLLARIETAPDAADDLPVDEAEQAGAEDARHTDENLDGAWRAGRDSNPRPSGSKNVTGARSDSILHVVACEALQEAEIDCTGDGPTALYGPSSQGSRSRERTPGVDRGAVWRSSPRPRHAEPGAAVWYPPWGPAAPQPRLRDTNASWRL